MNTGAPAFDGGGLSAATLQTIGAVLARFPQIDQALLYGSRAKGNFKPGSDIDLTLQGPALTQSVLGDIEEALDDLLLPYEIDLSIYEQLGNPELAAHIDPTDAKALAGAPVALARRAIRRWLSGNHPPDAASVERVLAVARGEVIACELPGGFRISRTNQRISITPTPAQD